MRGYLKSLVRRYRKRRNLRLGLKSRDPFVIIRELTPVERPLIFDVGAHVGLAATRFRELFPLATIHCFEPYPESFERLRAGVAGSRPLELHPLALAAAEGEATFSVNRNSATNSLLASDARGEIYWRGDTPVTTGALKVRTTTVDAFASARGIESMDILKMDVQGGEYEVLRGARDLLGRRAIGLIYMELITAPTYVGQHAVREYLEIFDAHGYVLFDLYNFGRSDGRLLQTDIIVVSPDVLAGHERRIAGSPPSA